MSSNSNWSHLSSVVHKAIEKLQLIEIVHAEAFFTHFVTIEVTIRNSEILTQDMAEDSGVGFRVVVAGNRVGFACTNNLDEDVVYGAAQKALSMAKVSSGMPRFALPEPRKLTSVGGMYDSGVAHTTVEESVEIAGRAIDAAKSVDKRVIVKDGRVMFMWGWKGIMNTLGVDSEEKETKAAIYLGASGKEDNEVTSSCYALQLSRKANLQPQEIGEEAARRATAMFRPKPLKSFDGPVIFGPEAVSYQLCDVLIDALKGDNVVLGSSKWGQKLGETVASENLTITDNAVLEGGFASRSFDDEGCVSKENCLVRNGTLASFLHHAASAKALDAENTGNASRSSGELDTVHMITGNGYRTKPEIYPSNLTINTGNRTKEELMSEMKDGVLVESMAGFAQKGSGIISAQLSRAFYVKNGEVQFPVRGSMVSGVGFNWFKRISDTSKDVEHFQNAIVPSLVVQSVKVVGS
jgi:PmbA protein